MSATLQPTTAIIVEKLPYRKLRALHQQQCKSQTSDDPSLEKSRNSLETGCWRGTSFHASLTGNGHGPLFSTTTMQVGSLQRNFSNRNRAAHPAA